MNVFQRILLCLSLCLVLISAPLRAEEDAFETARRNLQKDKQTLLRTLAAVSGGAAAVAVGAKVLRYHRLHSKSLLQMVEELAVPSPASRQGKYFVREKTWLKKEAGVLNQLVKMIYQRRPVRPGAASFLVRSADISPKTAKELQVLESVLLQRYERFQARLELYRLNYKTFLKMGRRWTSQSLVRYNPAASAAGRQTLKKTVRRMPLFLLFAWALSASEDAHTARRVARLEENPALVFTLPPEEEEAIRQSELLTEVYVRIAAQVGELARLSKAELQELVLRARTQTEAQMQVRLAREELRRGLAR